MSQAENKAELTVVPEKQVPVKFSSTKAAIKKMATKWKSVPDMTTPEGYEKAAQAKRELTPMRTAIEKEMKVQKKLAQEHIANINKKGGELTALIVNIEKPIYEAKKKQDAILAEEKRKKEEAEQNRIDDIKEKVDKIRDLTAGLLSANADKIRARLKLADAIEITNAEYMEFIEPASLALTQTKDQLRAAIDTAEALAKQQEEVDAQQKQQAKEQSERDIKDKINVIKMMPIDVMGASVIELENKQAELDLIEVDESYGDLAEEALTTITTTRAKLEMMIDQQKQIDAANAVPVDESSEGDVVDAEFDTGQETAGTEKLDANYREGIELRAWIDTLVAVELPVPTDPQIMAVIRDALVVLSEINTMVYENTQSPETEDS